MTDLNSQLTIGETVTVLDEDGNELKGELYRTPQQIDESTAVSDHEIKSENIFHVMLLQENGEYDHVISVLKENIKN